MRSDTFGGISEKNGKGPSVPSGIRRSPDGTTHADLLEIKQGTVVTSTSYASQMPLRSIHHRPVRKEHYEPKERKKRKGKRARVGPQKLHALFYPSPSCRLTD